jgi:YrbI family 3-deoxy-D-manno-octulosonate 8-phosphate phosphatase
MVNTKLTKKISKIKIVLTDVDGVLTDGGMYYSKEGDVMKKFHARDGMGVNLLRKNNIPTIIITKEKNQIIKNWAKKMNIKKVYDGIQQKEKVLEKICKEFSVKPFEVAFIGDDVNDLELLKIVGFSAVPHDGHDIVKKNIDYTCKNNGGNTAFREIADLILIQLKKTVNS